jgi:exopolysaccharide production protein ExoQ
MIKTRGFEKLIHFSMFLLLIGVFIPLYQQMAGANVNLAEGDPITRIILLCSYLITVPIILLYPRRMLHLSMTSILPWVIISFAFISILWSVLPSITLRRSLAILLTTLYGFALIIRFDFNQLLKLLGYALIFIMFFSLIFIFFLPEWGRMIYAGEEAWRGVFIHKNELGLYCSFALLVFISLFFRTSNRHQRFFWLSGIILALFLIFGSRSASGLVLAIYTIFGFILIKFLFSLRRIWQILLPILLLLSSIFFIFMMENYQSILTFLGRGQSLTGRIPLWDVLIPLALEHPWWGYGFGAFWTGWNGPSAIVWNTITYWQPFQAHNGYLDVFLSLGIIGFILIIAFLVRLSYLAFNRLHQDFSEGRFWILFCGYMIILSFIESFLIRQNNIFWVLMIFAYISLNNKKKEIREKN